MNQLNFYDIQLHKMVSTQILFQTPGRSTVRDRNDGSWNW